MSTSAEQAASQMSKDLQTRETHFLEQFERTNDVFSKFALHCAANESYGKHKITLVVKGPGLLTVHVPGLRDKLKRITAYIAQHNKKIDEEYENYGVIDWLGLLGKNGSRVSKVIPHDSLCPELYEDMLNELSEINDDVKALFTLFFDVFKKVDGKNSKLRRQFGIHFYKHEKTVNKAFKPHHDFGMLTVAFTLQASGGFSYYNMETRQWNQLFLEEDEAIINAGMYFQCMTSFPSVLHRVFIREISDETQRALIDEVIAYGVTQGYNPEVMREYLQQFSKFTYGCFNDVIGDVHPLEPGTPEADAVLTLSSSPSDYYDKILAGKIDANLLKLLGNADHMQDVEDGVKADFVKPTDGAQAEDVNA